MLNIAQYIPSWASAGQSAERDKPRPRTPLTPPESSDGHLSDGQRSEDGRATFLSDVEGRVEVPVDAFTAEQMKYDDRIKGIVEKEYPQLRDGTYLDNAAAPPHPTSLLTAHIQDLTTHLYSNPHSRSPSSAVTALAIERIRNLVLDEMFGVGPGGMSSRKDGVEADGGWDLIWTSGATAGLKLVGECFDWSGSSPQKLGIAEASSSEGERGEFLHLREAHTSLVGVRDLASRAGASVKCVALEELIVAERKYLAQGRRLIGMPLQCNSTGRKYLSHIPQIRGSHPSKDTYVLLDAAGYMSGHQTKYDLNKISYEEAPDFIAFSLYKVFGYPTGLGGLVVKRSAAPTLSRKDYFGGGTLDAYTSRSSWKAPRGMKDTMPESLGARFEDGTINYQAILAIPHGLRVLEVLFGPWEMRKRHVDWLMAQLLLRCAKMRHGNGEPVVKIYSEAPSVAAFLEGPMEGNGPIHFEDQGPTLNFNVLNASGDIVPPSEVDRLACVQNIHLREGRHCNSGVVTNQLGVMEEEIVEQYRQGYGCDDVGLGDGFRVSSSLRVSLGTSNTLRDVETFVTFLDKFFLNRDTNINSDTSGWKADEAVIGTYTLSQMVVYPIKSCAGQWIPFGIDWPLTEHGLEHDREWVLVNLANGKMLSQKQHPRMALIRPQVDRAKRILSIQFGSYSHDVDMTSSLAGLSANAIEICGVEAKPNNLCERALQEDLSTFLGIPCALAQQLSFRHSKLGQSGGDRVPLLLSNESPFLLINKRSVNEVSDWIAADNEDGLVAPAKVSSFRANFAIAADDGEADHPFVEDDFTHVKIGDHTFVALGRCRRCQMVAIDQETGEKTPETFLALAKHRRSGRGKIHFGQHLGWMRSGGSAMATIRAGTTVTLLRYS